MRVLFYSAFPRRQESIPHTEIPTQTIAHSPSFRQKPESSPLPSPPKLPFRPLPPTPTPCYHPRHYASRTHGAVHGKIRQNAGRPRNTQGTPPKDPSTTSPPMRTRKNPLAIMPRAKNATPAVSPATRTPAGTASTPSSSPPKIPINSTTPSRPTTSPTR